MPQKKISIIIPAYNGSNTLGACLNSVINQTMPIEEYEIIIIDDCSSDNGRTWKLICEYESRYPNNIIALQTEENSLPGGARNAGIPYATGELMTFADQDDYCMDDAFSSVYELYKKHNCDILSFDKGDWNKCKPLIDVADQNTPSAPPHLILDVLSKIKFFMAISSSVCWGKYFKTDLIKNNEIKFLSKCYHEEALFIFPAIALSEKILISEKEVYRHIDNKDSASYDTHTGSLSPKHFLDIPKSLFLLLEWYLNHPTIFQTFKREFEFFFLCFTLASVRMLISDYNLTKQLHSIVNMYFPDLVNNPYFNIFNAPKLKADIGTVLNAMSTLDSEKNFDNFVAVIKKLDDTKT